MGEVDEEILDRHLLVVATGTYTNPAWPRLQKYVDREVQLWTGWLTDEALAERRFDQLAPDLAKDPRRKQLSDFLDVELEQRVNPDDALVVVVTGHGTVVDDTHKIVLAGADNPPKTNQSLSTADLISHLKDTGVQHALVVIDTCHAGAVTGHMRYDKALPAGWIGIAAAAPQGKAFAGAVSKAVSEFLRVAAVDERYGGPNQRFFTAADLVQFITNHLPRNQDLVTFPRNMRSDPSPCLPNPHFTTAHEGQVDTETARQDLALRHEGLDSYWKPRAQGVSQGDEAGWLFTGRKLLMRDLIAVARGEPGAYLVTGAAGSGKSAVLARLVTLADPTFRVEHPDLVATIPADVLPAPGDVDVAIHARGRTPTEILDRLCTVFDVTFNPEDLGTGLTEQHQARLEALRTRLAARGGTTIVIDALDEATDPRGVLTDILASLCADWQHPTVRLVLGVRSTDTPEGRLASSKDLALVAACLRELQARELRVDTAPYWKTQDLIDYVASLLVTPAKDRETTPYTTAPDRGRKLAEKIAELAGTSYLLAQLVARQLAAATTLQHPDDSAWQATISAGLGSILHAELDTAFPDDPEGRRRALTVLRAASLAFGPGIPWRRIWPAIATAIADNDETYGDSDIHDLLTHRLGGYLVRDLAEDGTTVYRPFHHALTQALATATDHDEVSDPDRYLAEQHERITHALTGLLPARPTEATVEPDRYLRRHLAQHAAAAGQLDDLLDNPRFLVTADPDALLPLLYTTNHPAALVYRQAAHQLHGESPQSRVEILELTAHLCSKRKVARQFGPLLPEQPWRVKWVQTHAITVHTVISTHAGPVVAVAVGELDGRPVVVSGGDDRTVRVWDLATCAPVGRPLTGHTGTVSTLAVGELDGRPVIISGSYDGTIRVWDMATGLAVGHPLSGHTDGVAVVTVGNLDGRPVIISGAIRYDGTMRVWDLTTGAPIRHLSTRDVLGATTVAVGQFDGDPVVASSGWDRTVLVSDLASGNTVRELTENTGGVSSVAIGELHGCPVIISGSDDHTIRVWDLATGALVHELLGHSRRVSSVTVGELDGSPVIISGSDDRTIRVWDLDTGSLVGGPLTGHTGTVISVTVGELNGRPVIVSGGEDGTVRVWDASVETSVGNPLNGHIGRVTAVAAGELGGRPVIVSGGYDRTVRVWDATSGAAITTDSVVEHKAAVGAVAPWELDGRPVIISGGFDGDVWVWDLTADASIGELSENTTTLQVTAVTIKELDGRPVHFVGCMDGRVWGKEVSSGARIRELARHTAAVSALTIGELGGRPVLISGCMDGRVWVWDLATATPIGQPLTGHTEWVSSVAVGDLDEHPVVITGGSDSTVRVWDLATGRLIQELAGHTSQELAEHTSWVATVAVGELDGRKVVVSGGNDRSVHVWDLATWKQLFRVPLNAVVQTVCAHDSMLVVGTDTALIAYEFEPHREG